MTERPTLGWLASHLGGRLCGMADPASPVEGVSTLEAASSREVCYYGNRKYAKHLMTTRALSVIASTEVETTAKSLIVVKDPYDGFRMALELFAPDRSSGFDGVHPSAVLHPSVSVSSGAVIGPCAVIHRNCIIGKGVSIGSGAVLEAGVFVGDNTVIHSNVTLCAETRVGENTVIHSGTVVGSDGFGFVPDRGGMHRKVPQNGNVVIGSHVEIGANCCIDRAVTGSTVIGDHTKLDNLIQVAHNVTIGNGCLVAAQTGIAGSTAVGDGVVFGGQAGVGGHLVIGSAAVIAAKSGVTKNVPSGATVSGNPCREHMETLKIASASARLPGLLAALKTNGLRAEEGTEET
jgi:UDP-3-O-[3-hydroxymyristoyl] glucosamine N-acyltransferase